MRIYVPDYVKDVMKVLKQRGYQAYVVGGAVRDQLLRLKPNDYDIATNARPWEVKEIFSKIGWTVAPVGEEYGVILVVHPAKRVGIEVTTFRSEIYLEPGNRRRMVAKFADTLEDDVKRRDFTINGLASDMDGNIVDYVGGVEDIKRGIVRFIGVPEDRIREDPLRMLRAVRFASTLNFSLDDRSLEAIRSMHEWINYVSWERVGEEIMKTAKKGGISRFTLLLWESNLWMEILPELKEMNETKHGVGYTHYGETVFEHTINVLNRLDKMNTPPEVRLAGLLHDIGKPYTVKKNQNGKVSFIGHERVGAEISERVLRKWRLPRRTVSTVASLVRHHMVPVNMSHTLNPVNMASRVISRYGPRIGIRLLILAYADTGDQKFLVSLQHARKMLSTPKPLVDGRTIMELYGVHPGPEVGKIKEELYNLQLRLNLKTKNEVINAGCKILKLCGKRSRDRKAVRNG